MHSRRFLPRAVLGLAALACCGAAAAKGLYPTQFINVLNSPGAVVMADMNGDGKLDIVELGVDQTVTVLLGHGDGTFDTSAQYYVGGTLPESLAVADVNGDGKLDIILANNTDNTVSVLLGSGNGTFRGQTATDVAQGTGTPAPTYPIGQGAISVTTADLNGDGFPDIITANYLDNTISILINNRDGTFRAQKVITVGFGPDFVTTADLNGDGKPDIIVSDSNDNSFTVVMNQGANSYKVLPEVKVSARPDEPTRAQLVVGDFDHDGKLDIISTNTNPTSRESLYFPGRGDGTFGTPHYVDTGLETLYLQAVDVNGDGNLDLVAGSFANNTFRVLFGKGNGGFDPGIDYSAPGLTSSLASQAYEVADIRNNGKPDLVTVNSTGGFLQVLPNDGNGRFHLSNSYDLGSLPSDAQTADLNGDGHADVAEINAADGTLGVLLGNGDGTFQPMQTYKVGSHPQRLMLADVNGDGIIDAVTANNGDDTVSVLLGNGDGTFQRARNFPAGPNPVDVAVADMDQDGKMDLVVGNAIVNTVGILYNKGGANFRAPATFPASSQINALAVGDVNHDGFPDVVTVGGNVAVLRNDRKGRLLPVVLDHTGNSVDTYPAIGNRVILKDVNHDSNPDILITDYSNSELTVLLGNRLGYFSRTPLVSPTCVNPGNLAAGDLNADGEIDVAVSCVGSSSVGVMLGDGQGYFISNSYPAELNPRGVVIADFDEDGAPDLAVVNGGNDNMNVLLQIPGIVAADTAPRTKDSLLSVTTPTQPVSDVFVAGDADGDPLTYVLLQQPAGGTTVYTSGTGDYTYTSTAGFTGSDVMTFQVSDGVKLSNVSTVNIFVHPGASSSSKHGFLGGFGLPMLPLLGLFALLRRRRS